MVISYNFDVIISILSCDNKGQWGGGVNAIKIRLPAVNKLLAYKML